MNTKTTFFGGLLTGCVVGFMVGSYVEYTRVTATKTRQLLKENQATRDAFHMTDAELIANAKKVPQFFEDEKQQERMAAAASLGTYKLIALGEFDDAKAHALIPIGVYYQLYHDKGGDPQVIGAIEEAAKEYPEIATEIAKK